MPKVVVDCFGPINQSRKAKSLWEDVWLTWRVKPKRKNKKHVEPTLISKKDLERDIRLHKEELEDCKKENETNTIIDFIKKDLSRNLKILDELEKGNIYIEYNPNDNIPNIYTPKDYIDKNEAERMCKKLLEEYYDLQNIIFKWKRSNLVIIPA